MAELSRHDMPYPHTETLMLESDIVESEVKRAVKRAKKRKATGYDKIHAETLKNETSVRFLTSLFQYCFRHKVVPSQWNKCIINPIPKGSGVDPRSPLEYRGITITSAVVKLYCDILNVRLSMWTEANNVLSDTQNGFRRDRNCQDHLFTLSSIIETRLKTKKDTVACFIDMRKAFDRINRNLLWYKLKTLGLPDHFSSTIQSLYNQV